MGEKTKIFISYYAIDVSTPVHRDGGISQPQAEKLLSISSLAQSTFTKLAASDAFQVIKNPHTLLCLLHETSTEFLF